MCVFRRTKSTSAADARSPIRPSRVLVLDYLLSGFVELLSQRISIQSVSPASVCCSQPTFFLQSASGKSQHSLLTLQRVPASDTQALGGYMKCLEELGWLKPPMFCDLRPEECCQHTWLTFWHHRWTHTAGFTVHRWRPLQLVRFCTCLAAERKSDSAARLRFNISPLGKRRLIFFPFAQPLWFFFHKGSGRGQISLMFFHVCVLGWWGSGQGSDILARSVETFPKGSKIKGRWCLLHVDYCCISCQSTFWAVGVFVGSAMAESGIHVIRAPVVSVILPDACLQLDKPSISYWLRGNHLYLTLLLSVWSVRWTNVQLGKFTK